MKKKILLTFIAIFVLGIGIAAYAVNAAGSWTTKAMSCCCCKGDSCPMKKKDGATAAAGEKASCCDNCACCKDGSCDMKREGGASGGCSCCADKKS